MLRWCLCLYALLSIMLFAVHTVARSTKFSTLKGHRVSSGATKTGHIIRPAMTEILCASFCSSVCGMFHFNKVTNECATFMEGYDDTGVELTSDPDWNVSYSENPDCMSKNAGYSCGSKCIAFFVGCFHAKGPNTILPQNSLVNLRHTIDWAKWVEDKTGKDLIVECGKLAVEKNKNYFGVEYYGECYFGDSVDETQPKVTTDDGCEKYCQWDVGGQDAIMIYRVFSQ